MAHFRTAAFVSMAAIAYASAAHAQAAPASEAGAQDEGIGDIVVTAQRRVESGQNVPIAVAAFSADQLATAGVNSPTDIGKVVPGVTVTTGAARSQIYLRGIGNNNYGTSSAVLTFVDGVYQPFDATGGAEFNNLKTLELAKGPQGTLFGRNATGGVLQITTKNPLDWQGFDGEIGYANYKTLSGKAYVAAKFADNVAADLAGFYYNQSDGWGKNITTGQDVYTAKRYGLRSKFVADLGDDFTVTLAGDYSNRRGQLGTAWGRPAIRPFIFDIAQNAPLFLNYYDIAADDRGVGVRTKEGGGSLTLEKHFDEVKLLSITSYRKDKEAFRFDLDAGPLPAFTLYRTDRRRAFTQELQVSGAGKGLNWTAGLFYYSANTDSNGPGFGGFIVPFAFLTAPGQDFVISSEDMLKSYAAYAQGTVEILPKTNLTLGARYTIEKREIDGRTSGSPVLSPGSAGVQKETFKKPSFRASLDHKVTPDVLVYASWNRGFNAGSFSQQALFYNDAANPAIKPEIVNAYEAGVKSDWLNNHLRINASAFLYNYSNLQQQIFINNVVGVTNAGGARIKGLELELVAKPMSGLLLSFASTYLDAKYTSYPNAPRYILQPAGNVTTSSVDAAGKKISRAPAFSMNASATYSLDTEIGTFDSTVNVNNRSKTYSDPFNEFVTKGRTLLNLSERWTSRDGQTTLNLWVQNLTNKKRDELTSIADGTGEIPVVGAPRTYGITLGRTF